MHMSGCTCSRCLPAGAWSFPAFTERHAEADPENPFTEAEEMALADELLSVASEEELDLFLGKLFKKAWRGIKQVGRVVGKVAKPLGGMLKTVAKTALPFVGGALGSFIPIPGVGTALGSALGGALSQALEAELADLSPDERELEMARRFVRMAGAAAHRLALVPHDAQELEVVESAVLDAARKQAPALVRTAGLHAALGTRARTGRWLRRGNRILVLGA